MKPKEYVSKYNLLDPQCGFDHRSFIADLTTDFISLVEFQQTSNWSYAKFKNCVKEIRQKFDSILNKSSGKVTEKQWNYFFATVVAPMRDKTCGAELERKKREYEEKRRENQEYWEFQKNPFGCSFNPFDFFSSLFKGLQQVTIPIEHFVTLSLSAEATREEVKEIQRACIYASSR
jgi:hypothetical protein